MSLRWITVFLDFPAPAFGPGVAFWREVTGYGLSAPRGESGEFATLLPPDGDAYLRVQRVPAGPGGCHLDLHVDTASEFLDGAASRAVRLGPSVLHRDDEDGLIVARSPAGLAFCLMHWAGETVVPGPLVTPDGTTRVDTLCIDVPPERFQEECSFWARAHVDLGCTDELAIGRQVGLGARVVGTHGRWTVLTDPAGREYCLVSRDPYPTS
jgi:hypothetical protein